MKKFIVIIVLLISSFSFYGKVDENGNKIINIPEQETNEIMQDENVEQQEEIFVSESNENVINVEESKKEDVDLKIEEKEKVTEKKENKSIKNSTENKNTTEKTEKKTEENKKTIEKQEVTVEKVENKQDTQEEKQNTKKTEEKVVESPSCNETKHYVAVGNSNKWFDSYDSAVNYYDNLIKGCSDKVKSGEISYEEYCAKCPYGYEIWSCPKCNKWTLNYYYR